MSIFDWMADAISNMGSVIPGAVQEVKRGATFSHKTIVVDDNSARAIKALRDSGIDAWGGHPVRNGRGRGELDVRAEDYERAKMALNKRGFDCW